MNEIGYNLSQACFPKIKPEYAGLREKYQKATAELILEMRQDLKKLIPKLDKVSLEDVVGILYGEHMNQPHQKTE